MLLLQLPIGGLSEAFGQTGTIRGQVVDATTQETLPGVNVLVVGTQRGAATDDEGRFVIDGIAVGTYSVQASFIGFRTTTKTDIVVQTSRPTLLLIELQETPIEVEGVVVQISAFAPSAEAPTSVNTLGAEEIRRTPGGQNDISRSLLSLPGVTGGVDSRNDLLVRGGGPGENAYYLDGIRIPQINHFATQGATGGALGLLNVDFIREVDFFRGGFPVRYGDALSSVLLIKNRQGSPDRVAGDFTLGASETALTLDGPLTKQGNWLFSARRSYLQFLFQALDLPIRPAYWDFQTRLEYDVDRDNRFTFVGIGAIDDFDIVEVDLDDPIENQDVAEGVLKNDQRTYTIGATWRRLVPGGFFTTALSRSSTSYRFSDQDRNDQPILSNRSDEVENRLRVDGDLRLDRRFTLGVGGGVTLAQVNTEFFERVTPASPFDTDLQFENDLSLWESFAYLQLTARQGRLTSTAGLRVDGNPFLDEKLYVSPRLSASFEVSPTWAINASVGSFYQSPSYLSLVVRDEAGTYTNRGLLYIRANQVVAGVAWLPRPSLRLSLEGFLKDYANYPVSRSDPRLSLANLGGDYGYIGAEPLDGIGDGRAYGLELFAQRKLVERFYLLGAYTLAKSEFSGSDGVLRASSWDVRHTVSLTAGYRIGRVWEFGLKWRYLSGRPYTPFDAERSAEEYALTGRGALDFDQLNRLRTPAYHRLDIRVDRRFSFRGWNAVLYVDVQNLYNRENLFGYRYTVDPAFPNNERPVTNVGLLPLFGFSIEW